MRNFKYENEEINGLDEEFSFNNKNEKTLIDENYCLTKAKVILENHSKNTDDISSIIDSNKSEIKIIHEKQGDLRNQIKIIRETCEHDWKCNGFDSHYNYYICKKCGAKFRV